MNTMALAIGSGEVIIGVFFYELPGRKHAGN
jgi:hypothetical protein